LNLHRVAAAAASSSSSPRSARDEMIPGAPLQHFGPPIPAVSGPPFMPHIGLLTTLVFCILCSPKALFDSVPGPQVPALAGPPVSFMPGPPIAVMAGPPVSVMAGPPLVAFGM
jgi:hypothetical protein